MADDFEVGNGSDQTPDFDLGGGWGQAPADDAGADTTPAKAEPELTTEQALEKAYDAKVGSTDDAKSDAAWSRELRRLSDEALRAAGIDPERRDEANLSRRETTRRLYRAEQMIRQDLGEGVSAIIQSYGAALPPEQRSAIGQRVLQSLGFQAPGQIAEQDAQRLRAYDAQAQEQRTSYERALPAAQQTLDAFAASHEHFPAVGRLMGHMMQAARDAGEPIGLAEAYTQACRARGLATNDDAARAADEARRSKVANARAAGTPQTKSAPGQRRADPTAPSRSTTELLEAAYDELIGA